MGERHKVFFDNVQTWNIPEKNIHIAEEVIEGLEIKPEDKVIDIGCGTGILYDLLTERDIMHYVGIDISEGMLKQFTTRFPLATLVCQDFEGDISHIQGDNDYCIIFNSVPHFENLLKVFKNAWELLKLGGKLVITHCRTREGLKAHHKAINYEGTKSEPIPLDEELMSVCKEVGFRVNRIEDSEYFYFECTKEQ